MRVVRVVGFILMLSVLVSPGGNNLVGGYLRPLFVLGGMALVAYSHIRIERAKRTFARARVGK